MQKLQRLGLDTLFPPEKSIDLEASYAGVNQKPVEVGAEENSSEKGRMDLYQFDPYEMVVVYALTYIYSPKDQTVPFLLGSDDGVKVFLNGRRSIASWPSGWLRRTRTGFRWL